MIHPFNIQLTQVYLVLSEAIFGISTGIAAVLSLRLCNFHRLHLFT